MAWKLDGKVAIVTGCSSGIGLTTTRLYLEAGATVFGIDVTPFPEPSPFSEAVSRNFHFHRTDLTAPNACDVSVAACLSQTGQKVDILANIAGIMDSYEAAHNVKDSVWEKLMSVNATVPMRLMRAVLNEGGMLERNSGRIVNVASKAGLGGAAAGFAYTASKHAVVSHLPESESKNQLLVAGLLVTKYPEFQIGMTKQAAWRYHDEGITVNAVCPGGVATNIGSSIKRENFDQESFDIISPFHRLNENSEHGASISQEDIAHAILFLSVDASRNINGVSLPVDNAWSAVLISPGKMSYPQLVGLGRAPFT